VAGEDAENWVDAARAQVSRLAAAKGHALEWSLVALTRHGSAWQAACRDCSPPKSGYLLTLPADATETGNPYWDETCVPAYLRRRCRHTHEPRPDTGGGRAYALKIRRDKEQARQDAERRQQERRAWLDRFLDDADERDAQEEQAWLEHAVGQAAPPLGPGRRKTQLPREPGTAAEIEP